MTLQEINIDRVPNQPYKGLIPYSESDAMLFFGRNSERRIISANLRAAPLTLLYGPSGAGKSSVLRAGVAHDLLELGQQNLKLYDHPKLAVVVFDSWGGDNPMTELLHAIRTSPIAAPTEGGSRPMSEAVDLRQAVKSVSEQIKGRLFIILDQFEEYFLYHPAEEGDGTFADEFTQAVNDAELPVNFLVSIREDALAKMDHFKGRIHGLFDNYLRLSHLSLQGARDAIQKPLEAYSQLLEQNQEPFTVEKNLVDEVIEKLSVGALAIGAPDWIQTVASKTEMIQVETPYLQLVMCRLWKEEKSAGCRVLRVTTLRHLGGAAQIVGSHLDSVMRCFSTEDQDMAARIFHYLVTPSGSKIAHRACDLAAYVNDTDVSNVPKDLIERIENVLQGLARSGVNVIRAITISGMTRYEIFHDVLAASILDWRKRYLQARERAELASDNLLQCVPIHTESVTYDDLEEKHGNFVNTRRRHSLDVPFEFRMGRYLVTNEVYRDFVKDNGYNNAVFWNESVPADVRRQMRCRDGGMGPATWPSSDGPDHGKEQHPVAGICFHEARAFCKWLNERRPTPQWRWNLPTEDMWEYTARTNDGRIYPWGYQFRLGCCNSSEAGYRTTTDVDRFPNGRSMDGCYDMAGNVWEFVEASGSGTKSCVLRGGSFKNRQTTVRSYLRLFSVPTTHRAIDFGFRVAQLPKTP